MNPARVDAIIDLAYGALIFLSIGLIATLDIRIGLTFGLGVFASYILHVVWKMARFDPEWMTKAVQESVRETMDDSVEKQVERTVSDTVEESVERTVDDTVERTVSDAVEETVEQTVGDQLEEVQAQVESVDERVDRRPREDEVEGLIEESIDDDRTED